MRNLLYLLASMLIVTWAIGFFRYDVGGLIHILLIISLILILLGSIRGWKP